MTKINEEIIDRLSSEGYNIVIEGTLRNPFVTINTSELLKTRGYKTNLVIVGCDAEISWYSTISRAKKLYASNKAPRLVPFDKYDNIVTNLESNVKEIAESKTFTDISIVDRNGQDICNGTDINKMMQNLKKVINIKDWNANKSLHEQEYIDAKIEILQKIKARKMTQI